MRSRRTRARRRRSCGRPNGSGRDRKMPDTGGGPHVPPRLVVLAGRKGRPSLLPFVGVLLALLAVGLVGLLMLNTALNKGAFSLRQENRKSTALTQEDQQYQQELAKLSEPG